jgi:hypothetical protein
MMPTTTFSAGDDALADEAASVDVAAAAAAAEPRNERREVSVEIGVIKSSDNQMLASESADFATSCGGEPDCGTMSSEFPGSRKFWLLTLICRI